MKPSIGVFLIGKELTKVTAEPLLALIGSYLLMGSKGRRTKVELVLPCLPDVHYQALLFKY